MCLLVQSMLELDRGKAMLELDREASSLHSTANADATAAAADVAEWRVRVHAARRRVMLVVLTAVRLQRGLSHPRRMQRVDSFSLYIPIVLGEEAGRFVDETVRCRSIATDLMSRQVGAPLVVPTCERVVRGKGKWIHIRMQWLRHWIECKVGECF